MKLVPFTLQKRESLTLEIYSFMLFLTEGGRDLWEIGVAPLKTIKKEFLLENGFVCSKIVKEGDIVFAQLEPMNVSAFYTWEELQQQHDKKREDCFRTYHICIEKATGTEWFTSEILHTPFEKSTLTPSAVFHGLKNLHKV